jgi:alkylhydroperoxidase/carboxymuconolactone decarboxylase family protein YurZ
MDAKTAALVEMGVLMAIGSPAICLEWGTSRALAAGATEDEITGVLLTITPGDRAQPGRRCRPRPGDRARV